MAVYTAIDEASLRAFLGGYHIGAAVRLNGIAAGVENSNYVLITERGWPTPRKDWIYRRDEGRIESVTRIDYDRPLAGRAREELVGEFRVRCPAEAQVVILADHGLGSIGPESLALIGIAKERGAKIVAIPRSTVLRGQPLNAIVINPSEMRRLANASGFMSINVASGNNAIASGSGSSNVATGSNSNASGENSRNIAMGDGANASGDGSAKTAIGNSSTASGANSAAYGASSTASGSSSVAMGNTANAGGASAVAVGSGSTASSAVRRTPPHATTAIPSGTARR